MDKAFDVTAWQPTSSPEPGEEDLTAELPSLIATLNAQTKDIYSHPYDPSNWFRRGQTLARLRYPELAVADAYKAILLCRTLLLRLTEDKGYKLGHRMGFWMLDDTNQDEKDASKEELEQSLMNLQDDAHQLEIDNLYHFPTHEEGRFLHRPYPWMEAKHSKRADELMADINQEFKHSVPGEKCRAHNKQEDTKAPYCVLQRHAFGEFSIGDKDSSEIFGVFAGCDITENTVVLIDETQTWGCTGPGKDGSILNLHGGVGCSDPIHPNLPCERDTQDLRWIRDRCGSYAAEVILRCRFLIHCVRDEVAHPLDHTLIARLTPTFRRERVRLFSLDQDIVIPNECLQQFGIDVFANPAYDAWVFFTLEARIENNSWTDPIHNCISPLFSMFNHSCDPNVEWTIKPDHTTMMVRALRDIKKGEQLFVMYDGYLQGQPLVARRKRLRKWFDAECQCTKCAMQDAKEKERLAAGERCTCGCGGCEGGSGGSPEWDRESKPVFPEDESRVRKFWTYY